jgi:solute carrier family 29 (equilibrative nucleoside transporter), member 1/2/3
LVLRLGFFFFYLLIAANQGGPVILSTPFAFINSFLFAVTNGYCTAAFMTIGPELTEDPKKKEVIGFINGFALTFGISCGTFMAIIF